MTAASAGSSLQQLQQPGGGARPPAEQVHLFPPGSKTPLNLLYEKINKLSKEGWEKPVVEVRKLPPPLVASWLAARAKVTEMEGPPATEASQKAGKKGKRPSGTETPEPTATDLKETGLDDETTQAALGVEAGSVATATANGQGEDDNSSTTPPAWTAFVILRKTNKQNLSEPFTVRLTPNDERLHPELRIFAESSLHAKHWAATYALFRVRV